MTAVVTMRENGSLALVGDVVLSPRAASIWRCARPIYDVAKNWVVGWSGCGVVAQEVI